MIFLELEDALRIADRILERVEFRDVGLLASAISRPQQTAFGARIYSSLPLCAAALVESVVQNHSLIDGNKRLGFSCLIAFLGMNGLRIEASDDSAFEFITAIADGTLEGVEEISRWIETHTRAW